MNKLIIWITIAVQLISICTANSNTNDEPLGRNYRKNYNSYPVNSHTNNGKILSTSDTKISSVSYNPEHSGGKFSSFVDNSNLKTAASEEEKFSIGLGVLSPSYSQKFGEDGKTKLDFNSDKGGFSYSLTNVVHPHQPGSASVSASNTAASSASTPIATNTLNKVQSEGFVPSQYYNPSAQPNPQVNIYHKQTADPSQAIYGRLSSNGYPIPPTNPSVSPYSTNQNLAQAPSPISAPPQTSSAVSPYGNASPSGPFGYNPYNAAIGPQSFGALSEAEKSFLSLPPVSPQIGAHQHSLPQQLPPSHQAIQQPAQSITQPKLVAQQQLTANPNPGNIVHNANYGPYINPYAPQVNPQVNPYASQGNPQVNPYASIANPLASGYPGLNMAASQQSPMNYPMNDQMGAMNQMGGGMNYDYLNEFLY